MLRDRKPVHAETDPGDSTRTYAYSAWSKPPLLAKVTDFDVTRHQQSRADADHRSWKTSAREEMSWGCYVDELQCILMRYSLACSRSPMSNRWIFAVLTRQGRAMPGRHPISALYLGRVDAD